VLSPDRKIARLASPLGFARLALLAALFVPTATSAQSVSRVSVDSVAAIDLFQGQGASDRPDASVDISVVARLSDGWIAYARPWFFRSSTDTEWSKEIYQAALQYRHNGQVIDTRFDAGYIGSPIGLGLLDMRADTNPTIRPHLSYFVPLMSFDRAAPAVTAIAASYPPGAQLTVSTSRWDARGAVVGAAPVRRFALHNETPNPHMTPVLIAGGGVTPRTGVRLGVGFARGAYATTDELLVPATAARRMTMWSLEGEYAFGYTKIAAEFTHEGFQAAGRHDRAATWFVQATQTLSPRWFVAARDEGISAPPFGGAADPGRRLVYKTTEASVGFRISRELTARASWFASKWYTRTTRDQQVGAALVWSRRWW
jgi:hypothetical protein